VSSAFIDQCAEKIRDAVERLTSYAVKYGGISSDVIEISLADAFCAGEPIVIEGSVEAMASPDDGKIAVRPLSERAVLIMPRIDRLAPYISIAYFTVYVYANRIWLSTRTAYVPDPSCDIINAIIGRLRQ
jgi:hypothetical protein